MLDILAITGPIYIAIALGYGLTRAGLFSRADMRVLGQFVIHVALPALLFNALSQRRIHEIFNGPYLLVYALGFSLLFSSEWIVRNLRPKNTPISTSQSGPRGDGYAIPYGGGFRLVSSPQYLGEMLAWLGLAIASWGLPGLMILAITIANLGPRALATHRWYQSKFADYPRQRKALIPFVL